MQGRLFSDQFKTDATESVILNEEAVKLLGLEGNPIGQTLKCIWPTSTRHIVGVIGDVYFESLYNKVKPTVFSFYFPWVYHLIVKVNPSDVVGSIKTVTKSARSIIPIR